MVRQSLSRSPWTKSNLEPAPRAAHPHDFPRRDLANKLQLLLILYSSALVDSHQEETARHPEVKARICWKRVSGTPCLIGWPRTRRRGPFGRRRSDEARTQ